MAGSKMFGTHRTWEDWLGIALGLTIALAPWIIDETANRPAVVNAAIAGFVVLMLAELDLVSSRRWAEVAQFAAGAWVAVSPVVFGYGAGGALRVWHIVAGLLVMLIAALELWQRRANG
ncbi:MAG: SPW repeat protein [Hyphomicrobium sp.]